MLGVIFTGGKGPKTRVIRQLIETEAKDALFVAADSGLDLAESAGLKPDWIIGDMDSVGDVSCLASYPPERVIRHEQYKDYTDTELAFTHTVEQGCDDVWIIGGGGGRIDHLFAIRSLFERELFPRRWITDTADIRCIDGLTENTLNRSARIDCGIKKGSAVSVFPLGDGPWEAESGGLKWRLEGVVWDRGFFGLSNIAVDGEFSVVAKAGRFMVILPYCTEV